MLEFSSSSSRGLIAVCLVLFFLTSQPQGTDGFSVGKKSTTKATTSGTTLSKVLPTTTKTLLAMYENDHQGYEDDTPMNDQRSTTTKEYLATCIPGLSNVLALELEQLGASHVQPLGNAAVSFTNSPSNPHVGLRALLWVRTAHQILEMIVAEVPDIQTRDDVYEAVRSLVDVKQLLGDGRGGMLTMSSKVILNGRVPKDISHSHYTALTIKNALVDQVRDMRDDHDRPNVDPHQADVPLVTIFFGRPEMDNTADMTVYRSLHPPGSLHKRGYRAGSAVHKAAMKESLAAGLLYQAQFDQALKQDDNAKICLVDPMCGSGSLIVEAAMMAADVAPGLMRIKCGVPGFQMPPVLRWKYDNDDDMVQIWKDMLMDATQRARHGIQNLKHMDIVANDIHDGALDLLEASLDNAGLSHAVQISQGDCSDVQFPESSLDSQIWVMTNPPWGVRLSEDDHDSWESLRTFLREKCPKGRTQAWVLSGNKSATKHLGLRRSQSIVLKTGTQDLRWLQYLILEKPPKQSTKKYDDDDTDGGAKAPARKELRVKNRDHTRSPDRQSRKETKSTTHYGNRRTTERNKPQRRSVSKPKPKPVKVVDDDDSWY